jgi:hypothetical protein
MIVKFPSLPGAKVSADGADAEPSEETRERRHVATSERLKLNKKIRDLPFELCDINALREIRAAVEAEEIERAARLIDLVMEGIEAERAERPVDIPDRIAAADEDFPLAIWRYDPCETRAIRPALHDATKDPEPCLLEPKLRLTPKWDRDWMAVAGQLPLSGLAKIEAGFKGELVIVLFGGSVRIESHDGTVLAEVRATPGQIVVHQLFFVRIQDTPIEFVLVCEGPDTRGLWCVSSRQGPLDDKNRPEDGDVFFHRAYPAIGGIAGMSFSAGLERIEGPYPHKDAEDRGELARYHLRQPAFELCEPSKKWSIKNSAFLSTIIGQRAGAVPDGKVDDMRKLVAQYGGIELFVALDGVAWIAVHPEMVAPDGEVPGGPDHVFPVARKAGDPPHEAWMEPIVSTKDGALDVALLDPRHPHTAWMTAGSAARFLHVFLLDPEGVTLVPGRKPRPNVESHEPEVARSARGNRG